MLLFNINELGLWFLLIIFWYLVFRIVI
jgi:hypothetical protein